MNNFYNNLWRHEWKRLVAWGPSIFTKYRIIIKLIKRYGLSGELIDIGCGAGELLFRLKNTLPGKFSVLYGMDISEEAITTAVAKRAADVFLRCDLADADIASIGRTFDVVVLAEVLEHIEDYQKAIAQAAKLLKPNGHLIAVVPHAQKYWTQHDDFSGHFRRFEKGQIESELEKNGCLTLNSFAWGALIYNFYYLFLGRAQPQKIMDAKHLCLKKDYLRLSSIRVYAR